MTTKSHILITPNGIKLNGKEVNLPSYSLYSIYRNLIGDYPKFFKMDPLCKLGFIASELLLKDMSLSEKENGATVLFNRNGSLITDRNYQATISSADNYFPSPALFVYTLANIVTGEIAIRHKIYGESSFYILDNEDWEEMDAITANVFLTSNPYFILTGWVDYENENDFRANMKIVIKQ